MQASYSCTVTHQLMLQLLAICLIICIIVTSFLEVGPILLATPEVKFLLTERFCQDPLESYFGDQRSRGRRSANPNVQQFGITANILRVSGGPGLSKVERGNVRGREKDVPTSTTATVSLRKRKQKRS